MVCTKLNKTRHKRTHRETVRDVLVLTQKEIEDEEERKKQAKNHKQFFSTRITNFKQTLCNQFRGERNELFQTISVLSIPTID